MISLSFLKQVISLSFLYLNNASEPSSSFSPTLLLQVLYIYRNSKNRKFVEEYRADDGLQSASTYSDESSSDEHHLKKAGKKGKESYAPVNDSKGVELDQEDNQLPL